MGPILVVLTFFLMLAAGLGGTVLLFRWLMLKFTGYDPFNAKIQAHHQYLKDQVDFAQLKDWDHETGFVENKYDRKRKEKATPHYDRLYEMEQAQLRAAQTRLEDIHLVELDSAPVPMSELLKDKNVPNSHNVSALHTYDK